MHDSLIRGDVAAMPEMSLFLETERLKLRPFWLQDKDIAVELFTDPAVTRYVYGNAFSYDEILEQLPLETRRGAGGRLGIWCAMRRDTGEKVGTGVLLPLPIDTDDTDWSSLVPDRYPEGEVEVGYMLKREAWGNGYATEICRALLRFGFEQTALDEIKATVDPDNVASHRVLRKCGMEHEGLRRAYATTCDGYGITRRQWERLGRT
ncbi:MAG: GNAT family N-acetyltransferase [Roseovarius sp.]